MGLIILIVLGGLLGWMATILLRLEDSQQILANVAVGAVGALVGGLMTNSGSLLGGISPEGLLAACIGAAVIVALLNFVRHRITG